ncbi:Zn-ribbon domain-containing OB-fold protein [Bosea thiooxidans]|nr:OB-fold domain-containing protein [Bosea sp. (in: a-proteobacteria)]
MTALSSPVTDIVSDPFWQGTQAGKLLIQRCPMTGRHQWYPRAHSIHAAGATPEWVEASGRGTVFSFSTIHRGNGPVAAPYSCALIMLEEGVLMLSRLDGFAEDEIRIGMAVEAVFTSLPDGTALPLFRRREG